ncbi:MAG: hypothetical protein E7266_05090 [Lachnospiraceae bacterium]|nr:hypothetical protein [Lachnospiraceae bacterium]
MAIFKVLSKKNIYKKLPVINAKRAFYVSLFFAIGTPLLFAICYFLFGSAFFNDSLCKYVVYLFVISLVYMGVLYFADGMSYTGMFTPLYRGYFILSTFILICISHILFVRTGSLYVYIIATMYIAIIPVLNIRELFVTLIFVFITIFTFILSYNMSGFQIFQIAFTNIMLIPVTLWKYYATINSLIVKNQYSSRQSSFS